MLVGPKPALGVLVDGRLKGIPAELNEVTDISLGRADDRWVVGNEVASAGEGPAIHGDKHGPCALSEGGMGLGDTREKSAETFHKHAALAWIEVEIGRHAKFSTTSQILEHT